MNTTPLDDRHPLAIPIIKELPSEPDWEAVEAKLTTNCNRKVAPFEE